jgi:hypothetical protein
LLKASSFLDSGLRRNDGLGDFIFAGCHTLQGVVEGRDTSIFIVKDGKIRHVVD